MGQGRELRNKRTERAKALVRIPITAINLGSVNYGHPTLSQVANEFLDRNDLRRGLLAGLDADGASALSWPNGDMCILYSRSEYPQKGLVEPLIGGHESFLVHREDYFLEGDVKGKRIKLHASRTWQKPIPEEAGERVKPEVRLNRLDDEPYFFLCEPKSNASR